MTIWRLYEIFTGINIYSDIYENKNLFWYLGSSTDIITGNLTNVKDKTLSYVFSAVGNLSQNALDFTHLDISLGLKNVKRYDRDCTMIVWNTDRMKCSMNEIAEWNVWWMKLTGWNVISIFLQKYN